MTTSQTNKLGTAEVGAIWTYRTFYLSYSAKKYRCGTLEIIKKPQLLKKKLNSSEKPKRRPFSLAKPKTSKKWKDFLRKSRSAEKKSEEVPFALMDFAKKVLSGIPTLTATHSSSSWVAVLKSYWCK